MEAQIVAGTAMTAVLFSTALLFSITVDLFKDTVQIGQPYISCNQDYHYDDYE